MSGEQPHDPVVDLSSWQDLDEGTEHELGASIRSALDDHRAHRGEDPLDAFLDGVERRARRVRTRRRAGVGAGVLAAAAAVVAVATTGLGGPSSTRGLATRPAAPTASARPTGAASTAGAAPVAALEAADVLDVADVTAFGTAAVTTTTTGSPVDQGGPVTAGVCVDAQLSVPSAVSGARRDFAAGSAASGTGLVEKVWRFDDTSSAAHAVTQLRGQLTGCAGAGLEGDGPTQSQDASSLVPDGGDALAVSRQDGQGGRAVTVWLARGSTLVELDATYARSFRLGSGTSAHGVTTGAAALTAVTATASTAIDLATRS